MAGVVLFFFLVFRIICKQVVLVRFEIKPWIETYAWAVRVAATAVFLRKKGTAVANSQEPSSCCWWRPSAGFLILFGRDFFGSAFLDETSNHPVFGGPTVVVLIGFVVFVVSEIVIVRLAPGLNACLQGPIGHEIGNAHVVSCHGASVIVLFQPIENGVSFETVSSSAHEWVPHNFAGDWAVEFGGDVGHCSVSRMMKGEMDLWWIYGGSMMAGLLSRFCYYEL